jgi:S-DNA-T family DNA segregation ATPase FtsK/SpoIIIE
MLRKDEDVMDILTEIVAIGRTLGVFAILSMQRPNGKVLDTTIRANLTVSMGFKLRDKIEARIVNTPGAEEIDVSGRFVMNADKLYDLQAPYLELEDAKKLLNPFYVTKKAVKEVKEEKQEQPVLTEKDVFNDAVDQS